MKRNDKIKYIRTCNGLSQNEFAQRLGLSRSYIAGVESGFANVSALFLKCVAFMFDVSEEWLDDDTKEIKDFTSMKDLQSNNGSDEYNRIYSQLSPSHRKIVNSLIKDLLEEQESEPESQK